MTNGKQTATETDCERTIAEKYVVAEEVIREFVDNLKLKHVHLVSARLVLMAEVCQGLLAGELDTDHVDLLRATARRLSSDESTQLSKGILAAIEQGNERLGSLFETINRAWRLTTSYIRSDSSDTEAAEIVRLWMGVLEQRRKGRSDNKARKRRYPRVSRRAGKHASPEAAENRQCGASAPRGECPEPEGGQTGKRGVGPRVQGQAAWNNCLRSRRTRGLSRQSLSIQVGSTLKIDTCVGSEPIELRMGSRRTSFAPRRKKSRQGSQTLAYILLGRGVIFLLFTPRGRRGLTCIGVKGLCRAE